jgi:hypothetical protein
MQNKTITILSAVAALTLIAEKVSAQVVPKAVLDDALGTARGPLGDKNIDNFAQWANIQSSSGIYNQMRAGNDIVIRSELFGAVAFVALIIAVVMLMFRLLPWMQRCSDAGVLVPFDPIEFLTPLFLALLLANPTGQGFAMQNVVIGTNDLLNSFQTYILAQGGKATLDGGSAVRQANGKAQIEQSIYKAQITCSATLDQVQRQACYEDASSAVSAQLEPFKDARWAQDLDRYSAEVLLRNGKYAGQASNIGGAIGSTVGKAAKGLSDKVIGIGTGFLNPATYATLLLVSTAFGVVIGVLQTLMNIFFPLSIALSFAPAFRGTWVRWFSGIFQIWMSSLFLRMLVSILAIVTVSGSSVSGGLYVIAIAITAAVCSIMAAFSVISTLTGTANNVVSNIASLR